MAPNLAAELERLVALHDASSIAAVIVEPIAGSTGVLVPPKGYLQKLRELCTKHGILLIFDEVITGFGRTGSAFGAQEFGVTPDIITCAKGLTNGCVPMGAVIVKKEIYDAFMTGPGRRHRTVSWLHLFQPSDGLRCRPGDTGHLRARRIVPAREGNGALLAGRSAQPQGPAGRHRRAQLRPGRRHRVRTHRRHHRARAASQTFLKSYDAGILVRAAGDATAMSPPLIIEKSQIDELVGTLGKVIKTF